MKPLAILHAIPVGLALACVSGCAVEDWSDRMQPSAYSQEGVYLPPPTGPGLVASPRRWVPDVALPTGFEPVASQCVSRELPHGGRLVEHRYEGRATLQDVVRFYQRHLPLDGWTARDRLSRPGAERLQWTKGVETLDLAFDEHDQRIRVTVRISPGAPRDLMAWGR